MIRVGVLGTGFGKVHAQTYLKVDGIQIAGVFGRNREKLLDIEKALNVRVTADIEQLIHDPDIDLIDICLPTPLHAEYAIKALDSGKHVFCETPVSMTVEEAQRMKTHALRNNRHLFVDLFYKFSAPHRHICDFVRSGELGSLKVISAYNKTAPIWGDLGLNGIIHKFMLHNFDFLTELMGAPETVFAVGAGRGPESHVAAMLTHSDGFATVESSSMMPPRFPLNLGFSVAGENGTMIYDGRFGEETCERAVLYMGEGRPQELSFGGVDEYEEAIRHVADCIRSNRPSPVISIDHALASLRIADAVSRSLKTGCPASV